MRFVPAHANYCGGNRGARESAEKIHRGLARAGIAIRCASRSLLSPNAAAFKSLGTEYCDKPNIGQPDAIDGVIVRMIARNDARRANGRHQPTQNDDPQQIANDKP